MNVRVRIYIEDVLIREQVLPLNCVVYTPLLGIEVSKDARYPTQLMVVIDAITDSIPLDGS